MIGQLVGPVDRARAFNRGSALRKGYHKIDIDEAPLGMRSKRYLVESRTRAC